jgi:hypothetical protein
MTRKPELPKFVSMSSAERGNNQKRSVKSRPEGDNPPEVKPHRDQRDFQGADAGPAEGSPEADRGPTRLRATRAASEQTDRDLVNSNCFTNACSTLAHDTVYRCTFSLSRRTTLSPVAAKARVPIGSYRKPACGATAGRVQSFARLLRHESGWISAPWRGESSCGHVEAGYNRDGGPSMQGITTSVR